MQGIEIGARRDQVGAMVKILLNMDRSKPLKEDESDALAAAICHANTTDFATYSQQSARAKKETG